MGAAPPRERPFGLHPAVAVWVLAGLVLLVVVASGWGHAAWIDAVPGSGVGYGAALFVVMHLPGLLLATSYGVLRRGRPTGELPWWWQVGAGVVAAWYFSLLMTTFAMPGNPLSSLAAQLGPADLDVAVPVVRAAVASALVLPALGVLIGRTRPSS